MPRNYQIAKDHILESMPGTVAQLVAKSGYAKHTVQNWVRKLRAGEPNERACHVIGFQKPDGYGYAPAIYAKGPGKHAEYTNIPLTPSEKWKIAKKRHGMDALRSKEKNRKFRREFKRNEAQLDPLQALLCGRPLAMVNQEA